MTVLILRAGYFKIKSDSDGLVGRAEDILFMLVKPLLQRVGCRWFGTSIMPDDSERYKGLGGWLVLVVIGLVITAARLSVVLVTVHLPLLSDETWSALTSPESGSYHQLWAPLIYFEVAGNIVFVSCSLVLLVLFFLRKSIFPTGMIAFYCANLLFLLGDHFFAQQIPFIAQHNSGTFAQEMTRSAIASAIWIPYFIVSKRVRATFTN